MAQFNCVVNLPYFCLLHDVWFLFSTLTWREEVSSAWHLLLLYFSVATQQCCLVYFVSLCHYSGVSFLLPPLSINNKPFLLKWFPLSYILLCQCLCLFSWRMTLWPSPITLPQWRTLLCSFRLKTGWSWSSLSWASLVWSDDQYSAFTKGLSA